MHTPVLIVGGGPIGLALATDLGWRGIPCLLVEQGKGPSDFPRANAENARTMEFFRRWDIADQVRKSGTPEDFPHTVLYLTSLTGYEIARFDRPSHGGEGPTTASPERPQRCNQIWLDRILYDRATSMGTVKVWQDCRFESHVEHENFVAATVRDLKSGATREISADYLVACCGGRSSIRDTLGIAMSGNPALEYNVNIFFRAPELWRHHDKGRAALHFLVDSNGIWAALVEINGRDFWRLGLRGKSVYDSMDQLDAPALVRRAIGKDVPHDIVSVSRWIARDLVADRYGSVRVFLAGDAAHLNTPQGGFGMNTGMGDAVDLGWKLAAMVQGWGGQHLLASYEPERRPIAQRNVRQATENITIQRNTPPGPFISESGPRGDEARRVMGDRIRHNSLRTFMTDGTALGYRYEGSPIVWPDGSPAIPDEITEYVPATRPGSRAPHAWLPDGRSTLDLFGLGFTLVCSGENVPEPESLAMAFAARGVPLTIERVQEPHVERLYKMRLVLVRPDGHVAWRGDTLPADPYAVVDRLRGAAKHI